MIKTSHSIVSFDHLPEWDSFVDAHPKGTIFHKAAMVRTMKATKRHSPFAYAALDEYGRICAILVAVRVSTLGKFFEPMSTRSIFYAEPIYLETPSGRQGLEQLLQKHDNYMSRRALFAEVRPVFGPGTDQELFENERYERLGYLNYELNLNATKEQLFSRLNKKCRNNIRTAIRRGVTIREANAAQEVDRFYSIVSQSYNGSKVPLTDQSLFEAAFQEMPKPLSRLFFAEYNGEIAAAACFLAYKGRVIYWYAGAKRIKGVAAMALLVWETMLKYSAEGYDIFDFAGAGWEGEEYGPGKFKSKFGGELTNFGRYRKVYSPWKLRLASPAYQLSRGWISPTARKE